MSKIARIRTFLTVAAIALLTIPIAAAKKVADPPAAPIPVQILTGKKVFISNGESTAATGVPNLTYDEFYADMKSWGKYELVLAPADADLVFEIRFVACTGNADVVNGLGGPSFETQLHLLILDPKTRIVLWAFTRHVEGAILEGTARSNFDGAMGMLVENLKTLTTPPAAAPDAPAPNK